MFQEHRFFQIQNLKMADDKNNTDTVSVSISIRRQTQQA